MIQEMVSSTSFHSIELIRLSVNLILQYTLDLIYVVKRRTWEDFEYTTFFFFMNRKTISELYLFE